MGWGEIRKYVFDKGRDLDACSSSGIGSILSVLWSAWFVRFAALLGSPSPAAGRTAPLGSPSSAAGCTVPLGSGFRLGSSGSPLTAKRSYSLAEVSSVWSLSLKISIWGSAGCTTVSVLTAVQVKTSSVLMLSSGSSGASESMSWLDCGFRV